MATKAREVVCIVDDDASLRRSLRNLLSAAGFRAEMFDSAESFLASSAIDYASCLLVDLRMPGMSGFDLLQRLALSAPHPPVIIMTAHGEGPERRRALAAGAIAFLEKPFDSGVLFDAIARATETVVLNGHEPTDHLPVRGCRPVHVADGTLDQKGHVCALFSSVDEQHRVLESFIKEGLEAGEKAVHLVAADARDDHVRRLGDAGVDVAEAMDNGQLDVKSWEETYLHGNRFAQDAMLRMVDEAFESNTRAGYARTRLVANMEWALLDKPGVEGLIEYEARANDVVSKHQVAAICTYDVTKFSADVIMDVMRAHPKVIVGGVLQESPFYVPPDELLLELRERRSTPKG